MRAIVEQKGRERVKERKKMEYSEREGMRLTIKYKIDCGINLQIK